MPTFAKRTHETLAGKAGESVSKEEPFAARLRALRLAANLTITDLATAAGLSRQTIYNYEGGVGEPTWAVVQKLAECLGVSTDAFRTESQ